MTFDTRIRWLKAGAVITTGFGLVMGAAAISPLQGPTALLLDLIFFPLDSGQPMDADATRLLSAITGGLMAGLGVMLWIIAAELCPKDAVLGRRLLLLGIGSWYVVDTAMSVAAGAPLNVLFNTGFLLIFFVPAWGLADAAPR